MTSEMTHSSFSYRYRTPLGPPEERKGALPAYRRDVADGMIIEKDVAVTLRDGVRIYIDVFRPEDE
jgi:predicted acyl esterase